MAYAELIARTNFTFLEGASHPEELVGRAKELGLAALAVTDRDSLAGVVRAHQAAKEQGLPLVVGAQLTFDDAPPLVLLARDGEGYANLCELVSVGRLAVPKGQARCRLSALQGRTNGLFALDTDSVDGKELGAFREHFGEALSVAVWNHMTAECPRRLRRREALARAAGVPIVATNAPVMHARSRQRLQDVVTCIRLGTNVLEAGTKLFPNGERCLKGEAELRRLFRGPRAAWLERSAELAAACRFSLDELRYRFPREMLPAGTSPMEHLRALVAKGLEWRFPRGVPESVRRQAAHELGLVDELDYPGYFLTVWDIVRFARERGILCQGRGSAANSIVCYALGITSIDPVRMGLLFERFISRERNEPPDIDVDFEHERREEVLQYVYEKYGRDRAAMVAEVICYRGRSALREVAKAVGLPLDRADKLARCAGFWEREPEPTLLAAAGFDATERTTRTVLDLAAEIQDFPRHLSIHSGGFVVTHDRLARLVPLENGAMEGRTVVQWDKDDASAVGLLKIDLLSLGMLSLLARAFRKMREHCGEDWTLATIPAEDPAVYDMLCEADSVGVFQVESRAQMNMLPRLRPRCFYDLVVEVAIIRPGPIQGGMIHPYLKRRNGLEEVDYPHPSLRDVLAKTLGVVLFQEQAMRLAMESAGFSPGEADNLRRAMTHKRSAEKMAAMKDKLFAGMARNGIPPARCEEIYKQLLGFSGYGFPESHAASFALLVYASSWVKRHYPAIFAASLLNAQPMGFYAPHTIVHDARRHGVPVRPVDVFYSDRDCTLEPAEEGEGPPVPDRWLRWARRSRREGLLALRLGLSQVRGLRAEHADRLVAARGDRPWQSPEDLARRTGLPRHALARLAAAGALEGFGLKRREALWRIHALKDPEDLFSGLAPDEPAVRFDEGTRLSRIADDYKRTGLTADAHPLALLRPRMQELGVLRSDELERLRAGRAVRAGGMVIVRQRPQTAKGIVFITMEDEAGFSNLVVMPDVWERDRAEASGALFLGADGKIERSGQVVNVKVSRLFRLDLGEHPVRPPEARDFR